MPYLVDVVVDFLNANLTTELGASPTRPKAVADAAATIPPFPYIVVHDPDETYSMTGGDTFVGRGQLYCVIKSEGKMQAHAIGVAVVRKLANAFLSGQLPISDGNLIDLIPVSAHSMPLTETPPTGSAATLTERTIVFTYVIQYASA